MSQWNHGFLRTDCAAEFGTVDQVHIQAGACGRPGYPHHSAPNGQGPRAQGSRLIRFDQRIWSRTVRCVTEKCVGNAAQPGIGLLGQFGRVHPGELACRQAFQKRAGQSLRDQAERRVVLVGRDARQNAAGLGAQEMLRRRLLHTVPEFDQEQIDRTPIDEPNAVGVVELYRQVAGAGHGFAGAAGEFRDRCEFRPAHPFNRP